MEATPTRDQREEDASRRARYAAYASLQATAAAFGESLPIPEIVVIGGQSDGKSSLLEALLGFRFNIVSSEMGTRRPLVVQMLHDPAAAEPRCRLQDEDGDGEAWGPVLPAAAVAEEIAARTEAHLRRLGGATVSDKPIVLRAEFAHCPNITVIDTPGLVMRAREGAGDERGAPADIAAMARAQAAPPSRLVLFVQQSSVEWASSLWLPLVQEVDPGLARTVVVATKCDNRFKELRSRREADGYLSAAGFLPPAAAPFFVALPKDRAPAAGGGGGGDSAGWRAALARADADTRAALAAVDGGFDEARFGPRLGVAALRAFLEGETAWRYREAAPATLALLRARAAGAGAAAAAAAARLAAAGDVAALRAAAAAHALGVAGRVAALMLDGDAAADAARHGRTTDAERAAAGARGWPGAAAGVRPPHAGAALLGGAAFERCLAEFQVAAAAVGFAGAPRDRVANLLLAGRAAGGGPAAATARAARGLARAAARAALRPLLDVVAARLAAVLRHAYAAAAEAVAAEGVDGGGGGGGAGDGGALSAAAQALAGHAAYHAALRAAFDAFVADAEARCRALLGHHLEAATSAFADDDGDDDDGLDLGGAAAAAPEAAHEEVHENAPPPPPAAEQQQQASAAPPPPPPARARRGLAGTQLTVPETPSPEPADKPPAAAGGRRAALAAVNASQSSPWRGRVPKTARLGGGGGAAGDAHAAVCAAAARRFGRIRAAVAGRAAPATLRAAFLGPVAARLGAHLVVAVTARADADFLPLFTAPAALAALEADAAAAARRADGLRKMADDFEAAAAHL